MTELTTRKIAIACLCAVIGLEAGQFYVRHKLRSKQDEINVNMAELRKRQDEVFNVKEFSSQLEMKLRVMQAFQEAIRRTHVNMETDGDAHKLGETAIWLMLDDDLIKALELKDDRSLIRVSRKLPIRDDLPWSGLYSPGLLRSEAEPPRRRKVKPMFVDPVGNPLPNDEQFIFGLRRRMK